ncbi:MAG: hypothetical protein HQ592_16400 [Planctomycetes bacterium]|nr:hypothetical protein [Planctomycetota bacterium]
MNRFIGKKDLIRSTVVAAAVGLVAPTFTFTIHSGTVATPGVPMVVPDLDGVDLEKTSPQELQAHLDSPDGMKEITGVEKLLYPFRVPGAGRLYLGAACQLFLISLVSCLAVTAWSNRKGEDG